MSTVAFDTETKGLSWWRPEEHAFLVTWATADGEWWADLSDPDSAEVRRFLEAVEAADTIVGHNLGFDVHQIRETLGVDIAAMGKGLHDTAIQSRVLFPEGQAKGSAGGHGLKNLMVLHLNSDAQDPEEAIKQMAKDIGLRTLKQTGAYYEVYLARPDEMIRYALQDARGTYDLHSKWHADASSSRVYGLEREVLPILLEAERVGIATDQEQLANFKRDFGDERQEIFERLATQLGEQALGGEGSDEALREALLKHGVPLNEHTPTGELSTNRFALQPFEKDFPVIADLFEYRRLERFLSTYIGPMDGVDVIHPSFYQIGAWTGRMSCRRPNMQNWPKRAGKQVRSVLVPRPGHALVVCDYESIEVRLLAYYLGDSGFRELIDAGHDPHAWMAAQIWGGEPADYAKGTPGEERRSIAKNILFAITYGAGARRVGAMLLDAGMPDVSPQQVIGRIKSSLPNYYHLTKHRIEPKVKSMGYVNTITGRKNPVNKDKAYVGLNALIQGSAADIMKLGLINVARDIKTELSGARPLLVVHDEVVVECPAHQAQAILDVTKQAMVNAWDLDPPLAVEGSICYHDYSEA